MIRKIDYRRVLIYLTAILFFTQLVFLSLNKGGRWDLNEQIAMADRVAAGEIYYSTEQAGFYLSSSPYFPGVSFLSLAVSKVSYEHRDTILLLIATSVGILFLYMLARITIKMGVKKEFTYLSILAISIFYFNSWKSYMTEFKPDSLVLLLGVGIFYNLINITEKGRKLLNVFLILFYLITIGLLKQQSIAIYIGIFLFSISSKQINNKDKGVLIISIILSGLIVLGVILLIPNCLNNTIMMVKQHPIMSLKDIIIMFYGTLKELWLFFILLIVYVIDVIKGNRKLNIKEKIWLFLAVPWLFLSLLSAIKVGGNGGNIEVGFLPFIPFVVLYIYDFFGEKNNLDKLVFVFLIILIIIVIPPVLKGYSNWNKIQNDRKQIVNYLNDNFYGKTVLFNGDVYMQIMKSGLIPKSEVDTALGIFGLAGQDMTLFYKEITNKKYDLIYIDIPIEAFGYKEFEKSILDNYEYLKDDSMPEILENKIMIPKR